MIVWTDTSRCKSPVVICCPLFQRSVPPKFANVLLIALLFQESIIRLFPEFSCVLHIGQECEVNDQMFEEHATMSVDLTGAMDCCASVHSSAFVPLASLNSSQKHQAPNNMLFLHMHFR